MMKTLIAITLLAFSWASFGANYKGLIITPESHESTYKRAKFKHWIDADGDGEDSREEVLSEEKIGNIWVGLYTGFITDDGGDLDVDHMIPLKEAWTSGAWNWTPDQRASFANDVTNSFALIAVKAGSNRSKGAKDPASWMPPNRAYWCQYLEDWVEVKKVYSLTIDQDEVEALKVGFRVCKKYKSGDALSGRH